MGNIIGEGFNNYVRKQIRYRQKLHGSLNDRSLKDLTYLNGNSSWIKMASSTIITDDRGIERLKELELSNEIGKGVDLAKNFVLFNGTSRLIFDNASNLSGGFVQKGGIKENKPYTKVKTNKAYGVGGLEFGQQPMPGITDLTIQAINKGSLRKATIKLKAYNKQQLAILDVLYLRLGFTVLVEFGNSHYLDNKGKVSKMGSTLIEEKFFSDKLVEKTYLDLLPEIEKNRLKYCGNYDGFFARVVNFNWTFNPDGSYDITIYLISIGDVIESLKVNTIAGKSLLYEYVTSSPEEQAVIATRLGLSSSEEVKNRLQERLRRSNKIFDYLLSIREYYDTYKFFGSMTKEQLEAFFTPVKQPDTYENPPTIVVKQDGGGYNKVVVNSSVDGNFAVDSSPLNQSFYSTPSYTPYQVEEIKRRNPGSNINDDGSWAASQPFEGQQGQILYQNYLQSVQNLPTEGEVAAPAEFATEFEREIAQVVLTGKEAGYGEARNNLTSNGNYSTDLTSAVNPYPIGSDDSIDWDYLKFYNDFEPENSSFARDAFFGSESPEGSLKEKPFYKIDENKEEFYLLGGLGSRRITGSADSILSNFPSKVSQEWSFYKAVKQTVAGRAFREKTLFESDNVKLSPSNSQPIDPDVSNLNSAQKSYLTDVLPKRYYDGIVKSKQYNIIEDDVIEPPPTTDTSLPNVYFVKGDKEIPFGEVLNSGVVFTRYSGIYKYKRQQNSPEGKIKESFRDHYFAPYDPSDFGYYIRLGNFLGFLQDEVMIKVDNVGKGKNSTPIFNISTDIESNIMFTMPNHISLDPRVCITNVDLKGLNTNMKTFKGLEEFQNKKYFYGKIMNIYISHMFIEETMRNSTNSNGDISLYTLLEGICSGINRALGGVNNLHPSIDETVNCVKIYDDTPISNIEEIKGYLKDIDEKSGLNHYKIFNNDTFQWNCDTLSDGVVPYSLNLYGYNGENSNQKSRSNFIKNVSLTTTVTPNMSTMLSIGATANGYVIGEDSTAFSKWNYGIDDRYYQNYVDGDGENFNSKEVQERNEKEGDQIQFQYVQFLFNYFEGDIQRYYSGVTKVINEVPSDPNDPDSEKIAEVSYIPGGGQFFDQEIESNLSVGTEFYRRLIASASLNQNLPAASTQGFLPISLKVDMDGLSGVKIYQKVEVDTSFLPNNYPDNMSFITTGLDHVLSNNTWTTQLTTLATSQISNTPIKIDYFAWDREALVESSFKNQYNIDKNPFAGRGNTAMGSSYKTNPNPIIVQDEDHKKKFMKFNSYKLGEDFDNFELRKGDDNPNSNVTKFKTFLQSNLEKRIVLKPAGSGTQMGAGGDISNRLLVALQNWYKILGQNEFKDLYNGALGTSYIRISGANDKFHHGLVFGIDRYPLEDNPKVGPWNTTHTRGLGIDITQSNPYSNENSMRRNLLIQKSLWMAGFKGILHHGTGDSSHIHANVDSQSHSIPVVQTAPEIVGLDNLSTSNSPSPPSTEDQSEPFYPLPNSPIN